MYFGLLWFSFFDLKSPIRGIELYRATDAGWFEAQGLFDVIGVPWIEPTHLQLVIYAVIAFWIAAGLGLFFRVTSVLTAIGVVFLHGVFLPTNAMNHAWYLTMYTLVALCLSRPTDTYSLDHRLVGRKPSRPMGALLTTGFCRKLVLVMAVGFYFSAGMSKLTIGGIEWMDGQTLKFALQRKDEVSLLGRWVSQHAWLCAVASAASFVLELGAPLALFRKVRIFFVLGWVLMHIGIRVTLGVFYDANCWVMVFLVDWQGLRARLKHAKLPALNLDTNAPRGVHLAWIALPLWLAAGVAHIEWWPLTAVDMYSAYHTKKWSGGRPYWHYHKLPQLQQMARECQAGRCSRHTRELMAGKSEFVLCRPNRGQGDEGGARLSFAKALAENGRRPARGRGPRDQA